MAQRRGAVTPAAWAGTVWKANFNRWDGVEPNRPMSIWSDPQNTDSRPRVPSRFGEIEFVGQEETIDDMPPVLAFEFRVRLHIGAPLDQGAWDGRRRRIMPITGGTFEGPRFSGTVLPGGADWQSVRVTDGVAEIEARYTLRHEDGTLVSVVDRGVRRGPSEVMARLAAGEVVDPPLYYFRTTPRFQVQDGPHQWLADNVFISCGIRRPDGVELEIFRVL